MWWIRVGGSDSFGRWLGLSRILHLYGSKSEPYFLKEPCALRYFAQASAIDSLPKA